jgi:hypothetical protein
LIGFRPDDAREIGYSATDELPTDIKSKDVASIGSYVVEDRGRAANSASLAGDTNEAVVLEVGERKSHGWFGEARYPSQLSSGERPVLADLLEQELLVHRSHELGSSRTLTDGTRH